MPTQPYLRPRSSTLRRALMAVAASLLPMAVQSQTPVVFVHGNGDHAGLWDNVIWRFESNGYPASRWQRLGPVLRERRTGRYAYSARGGADVVRDLLQPVD